MKLFRVIGVSFWKIIHYVNKTLDSFKTTLLQREGRGDGAERLKMKKRSYEECSLQITKFPTQAQFIHS